MKFVVLKIAQKFPRILGLLLCEMCYQEDEKNRPIWSHWHQTLFLSAQLFLLFHDRLGFIATL